MAIEISAVVIAIAFVVQLVIQLVLAYAVLRMLQALLEIVRRLDREIHPIVLDAQEISGSLKGMVQVAERNVWRMDQLGEHLIGNVAIVSSIVRRVFGVLRPAGKRKQGGTDESRG